MKKLSLVLIFITGLLNAQSGSQYSITVNGNGQDLFFDQVETSTAFFHVGYVNDNGMKVILLKSDKNGHVLWMKTYGRPGLMHSGEAIIENNAGELVIGGWCTQDSLSNPGIMLLMCVDTNGTELWSKSYDDGSYTGVSDLTQTSDGGYLICTNGYSSSAMLGCGQLLKTDANGNMLWQKMYVGSETFYFYRCDITPDGNIAVMGQLTYAVQSIEYHDLILMQMDSAGNLLWSTRITPQHAGYFMGLKATSTGDILATGMCDSVGLLIKVNSSGVLQWNRAYDHGKYFEIADVNEIDGNYIFAGSDYIFDYSPTGQSWNIVLVETNTLGYSIWGRELGGWFEEHSMRMSVTSDTCIIVTGHTNEIHQGWYDGYIVKTDRFGYSSCNTANSAGNVVTRQVTQLSFQVSLENGNLIDSSFSMISAVYQYGINGCVTGIDETDANEITLYPNPVGSQQQPAIHFTVSAPLIARVYSTDGSLVSEQKVADGIELQIPKTPGIYFVRLYNENEVVFAQKIIRTE